MIPRAASQVLALLSAILMIPVSHVHAGHSLAGTWRFALDPDDAGLTAAWWRTPDAFEETIPLPGTTDLAGKGERQTTAPDGEHHLTREFHHLGPAWFQRDINIPESWQGRRIELTLERVMWQSRVWIDDREISPPPIRSACPTSTRSVASAPTSRRAPAASPCVSTTA